MSWSVSAQGPAAEVLASLTEQLDRITYLVEPERTVKDHIANAIEFALRHFPNSQHVRVWAGGHQGAWDGDHRIVNTLKLEIEPIYPKPEAAAPADTTVTDESAGAAPESRAMSPAGESEAPADAQKSEEEAK